MNIDWMIDNKEIIDKDKRIKELEAELQKSLIPDSDYYGFLQMETIRKERDRYLEALQKLKVHPTASPEVMMIAIRALEES